MSFRRSSFWIISLIVALNYFSFRVELFDREEEASHPNALFSGLTISSPTVNWESFDKDNAPCAFTVSTAIHVELLSRIHHPPQVHHREFSPFHPVRDKSPPSTSFS